MSVFSPNKANRFLRCSSLSPLNIQEGLIQLKTDRQLQIFYIGRALLTLRAEVLYFSSTTLTVLVCSMGCIGSGSVEFNFKNRKNSDKLI